MVLLYTARCAASSTGVDNASGGLAGDGSKALCDSDACRGGIALDQHCPFMELQIAALIGRYTVDRDDIVGNAGAENCRDQRGGHLLV